MDILSWIVDLSANIIHHEMKHYIVNIPIADEWSQCGRCNDMNQRNECVCCYSHTASHDCQFERNDQDVRSHECITDHPGVLALRVPAPLDVMWENFKSTLVSTLLLYPQEYLSWY